MNNRMNRQNEAYDPKSLQSVRELFEVLQGRRLETIIIKDLKLTPEQAFSVIYFLQEHMGLIPDHYEKCDECGCLFDTESEGGYFEGVEKFKCGQCE